jgi:hypothetical protein
LEIAAALLAMAAAFANRWDSVKNLSRSVAA